MSATINELHHAEKEIFNRYFSNQNYDQYTLDCAKEFTSAYGNIVRSVVSETIDNLDGIAIYIFGSPARYEMLGQSDLDCMIVSHLLDVDSAEAVEIFKFSNCAFTQIENGMIEYMNDRTHLGNPIKKIHIFGGWGAGKTTLGSNFSSRWGLPLYSLDVLKYDGVFERTVQTRISMLDQITKGDNWITEGAWTSYAQSAFDRADILIYCDTELEESLLRAQQRETDREYSPLASHPDLLTEIRRYHTEDLEVSRITHDRYFENLSYKCLRTSVIDFTKISFPEDFWDYVK